MIARRLTLTVPVSVCLLVCVLALGAGSAAAAPTEFGEEGTHSGQFNSPRGVAINQETGDVYISEQNNFRIDRFAGSGEFLRAWGWRVNEESPVEELQTCTTLCQAGVPGTGAGEFAVDNGAFGLAVDNEPDVSHGDVYAVDWENYRVEKFGPKDEFVLMFGGGVITGGASGTGDVTSGSETITSVTTTSKAFLVGQIITGAGIPAATKITRVGELNTRGAATITLSQPAKASGAGVALTVAAGAGNVAVNEQQTVTIGGAPTGGTFTLAFTSPEPAATEATTAPIAHNAEAKGAGSVQAALEGLSNIGAGNVVVTGSAAGPYTVEFKGVRYADTNVTHMSGSEAGLTGGAEPNVTVATTVEGHSAPEVCSTASACQAGAPGTADGQFEWSFQGSYITVGPSGRVYVGDRARVQVFEPSGVWRESISLAGVAPEGQVTALAVDANGNMFVKDNEAVGVQEFEPNGTQKATQFDAGSYPIEGLAVDGSGDLYLGDESGGFHVLKYDPAGKEIASFGSKTIVGFGGMAFADAPAPGELYVAGSTSENQRSSEPRVVILTPPPAGPLVEPGSESAKPGAGGEAKLEAQVIPEGNATTFHFAYVDRAHFLASGYASAASTAPVSIGSGFEDQLAEATLPEKTLVPGETYYWRLVATDSLEHTTIGVDETFKELPAALVEGPGAADLSSTSVTLAARIDPLGASTSYRLEYGTSTAYDHVFTGNVGEGEGYVPISYHVQELESGTTYHYRLVTSNKFGTVEGADHTFATQAGSAVGLPDGRAWELVSPANTGASVFHQVQAGKQAASDGSAITYSVGGFPLGEDAVSKTFSFQGFQVLSRRGPGGWRSGAINPLQGTPEEGLGPASLIGRGGSYELFSSDLASSAVVLPISTSFSPEALAGTEYLRNNVDGSYTPLLTHANVWPGTTSIETSPPPFYLKTSQVDFLAGTPDLGHVLLQSPLKLTEEAFPFPAGETIGTSPGNLYEWGGGRLQLVNRLPKTDEATHSENSASLAGVNGNGQGGSQRSVSNDGRWVAWTRGNPYGASVLPSYRGLYLRDMVAGKTVQLGGSSSLYQTMSSDGSRVFFLEKGDLYEYDSASGVRTDLSADHGPGEANAGVQNAVSDVSKDGSYVYFVATGKLAEGAVSGEDNLYLSHDTGGKWSTSYVTTLSSEDERSWTSAYEAGSYLEDLSHVTSRVSPDGRYLAFMSQRSLTGYDNVDANPEAYEMKEGEGGALEVVVDKEGKPVRAHDVEAYLYDAVTARLVCVSCDPGGARPIGVFNKKLNSATGLLNETPLVEHGGAPEWGRPPHRVAGSLPGWQLDAGADTLYQPRYLSDSGRLFFNSPDALVPQDTNGLEDVYQYEPPGVGDCTGASATFGVRSGGCVGLISSGTSSSESAFIDASESGEDVFFLSSYPLTTADQDTGYDVWDAHVCSASTPCVTSPVSPPPCSSGDSCKPAPAPQPEIFGPSPSATFSGAGNVAPSPAVASKPKSKPAKCKKGFVKKHNKCVKAKAKKKKTKAKKASNKRRGKS
jgi:WD40-like Beta Propeller Repeat